MIVTNHAETKVRVAAFANDIPLIIIESGLVSMIKKIKIMTRRSFCTSCLWIKTTQKAAVHLVQNITLETIIQNRITAVT